MISKSVIIFLFLRLIKFSAILLIVNGISGEKSLNCEYKEWDPTYWSQFDYCLIEEVDLSSKSQTESFTFTGTKSQKTLATGIAFRYCLNNVDFLPENIVSNFPYLKELVSFSNNIPTLKNGFFTEQFENLQLIYLAYNGVQKIEENAFSKLPKLKWIDLRNNQLDSIKSNIFANNLELEFIWLNGNKVNSINTKLFQSLNNLKFLDFRWNPCVDKELGCEKCSLSQSQLNEEFSTCFSNCGADPECS